MLNSSDLDQAFHLLSDPTRRGIVTRLSRGPASVGEIARPLAMSLPAVLQHLKLLEASGLVATKKTGRVRTCRLQPQKLAEAESWIAAQRREWEARLDRLQNFIERTTDGTGE